MTTSPLRCVDYADAYRVALPEPTDAPSLSTRERNYRRPVRQSAGRKFGPLTVQSVAPDLVACGNTDKCLPFLARIEVDVERQWGTSTLPVGCR